MKLDDLASGLANVVTRAKLALAAFNAAGTKTIVQVKGLRNETLAGIELLLPYGMSAIPVGSTADFLVFQVNNYRDQKVAVGGDDPALRIADLQPGEYGWRDARGQQFVFRVDRLEITSPLKLVVTTTGDCDVNATGNVNVTGATIVLAGGGKAVARVGDTVAGGVITSGSAKVSSGLTMDIALVPTPIVGGAFPSQPGADIGTTAFGDLALDQGLQTSCIISLLSDRRADDSDFGPDGKLPDGTTDRRGFWADPDLGSKLWLRQRSLAIPQTLNLVVGDIRQALQWGITDGVWQRLDVSAFFGTGSTFPRDFLGASAVMRRVKLGASTADKRFDVLWRRTLRPAPMLSFFAWDTPGAGFDTSGIVWD